MERALSGIFFVFNCFVFVAIAVTVYCFIVVVPVPALAVVGLVRLLLPEMVLHLVRSCDFVRLRIMLFLILTE